MVIAAATATTLHVAARINYAVYSYLLSIYGLF